MDVFLSLVNPFIMLTMVVVPFYLIFTILYFDTVLTKGWFKTLSYPIVLLMFLFPTEIVISAMSGSKYNVFETLASMFFNVAGAICILSIIVLIIYAIISIILFVRTKSKILIFRLLVSCIFFTGLIIFSMPKFIYDIADMKSLKLTATQSLSLKVLAQKISLSKTFKFIIGLDVNKIRKPEIFTEQAFPVELNFGEYGGYKKLIKDSIETQTLMCEMKMPEYCDGLAELYMANKDFASLHRLAEKVKFDNKKRNMDKLEETIKPVIDKNNIYAYLIQMDYDKASALLPKAVFEKDMYKNIAFSTIYAGQGDFQKAIMYATMLPNSQGCSQSIQKTYIYKLTNEIAKAQGEYETALTQCGEAYKKPTFEEFLDIADPFYDDKVIQKAVEEKKKMFN